MGCVGCRLFEIGIGIRKVLGIGYSIRESALRLVGRFRLSFLFLVYYNTPSRRRHAKSVVDVFGRSQGEWKT